MYNIITIGNNTYTYVNYKDINIEHLPKKDVYKKSNYMNIGCGFDIETTKCGDNTFMYVWQLSLDNLTIIGRKWEEFIECLDFISDYYKLNNKKRLLCYIHNMAYEWQFIRKHLKYNYDEKRKCYEVFALDKRKVIKAVTYNFIEFRDSLVLTNKPLSDLPKTYKLPVEKLSGAEFDYTKQRNEKTRLTDLELAYCINDVQILQYFFHYYIKKYFLRNGNNIPLTSTSIVRCKLKNSFKNIEKNEREKMKDYLLKCRLNEDTYKHVMKFLYRGGLVKSYLDYTDETYVNDFMFSFDIKSSYPASLLHELYPMKFIDRDVNYFYKYGFDKKHLKNIAYFGDFTFENIRVKKPFTSLESKHKLIYYENAYFDNGRLIKADKITVCLCEQDMLNYDDIYVWDNLICNNLKIADKKELPHYIKDVILEAFMKKESLNKDTLDYTLAKYDLNSIYGCMCTGIFESLYTISDSKDIDKFNTNKTYDELTKNDILLAQWGIWCSAYSRRALVKSIVKTNYTMYCDTDSNKQKNMLASKWYFDAYNDRMERINKKMYVGNYERKYFLDLGKWQCECKMLKFKTLGCKRYIDTVIEKDNETEKYKLKNEVTVAGMRKGTFQKYCKNNNLDLYDNFKDGIELLQEDSEKLTSIYNDDYFEIKHIDYQGNECIVSELSSISLIEIPFHLKMQLEYLNLINDVKQKNNIIIGDRIYG